MVIRYRYYHLADLLDQGVEVRQVPLLKTVLLIRNEHRKL